MAVETALSVLRAGDRAALPSAIVISGPQAFLREYVFDTVRRRMLRQGMKYRGFQVGGAEGFDAVLAELREADLFAPGASLDAACCARIAAAENRATMTTARRGQLARRRGRRRGRAGRGARDDARSGGADRGLRARHRASQGPPRGGAGRTGDKLPARLRQSAHAIRRAFARVQDLRLGPGVAELLVSRHAGDLSAIANTLAKAAIPRDPGATLNSGRPR